jgi:apolipoprotein N-acyltransferase
MIFLLQGRQGRPALALFGGVAALSVLSALLDGAPLPASAAPLRIVQPNIGQQDKWEQGYAARNFAILKRLSRSADPRPRILLWPEAAVTDPLQNQIASPRHQRELLELRASIASLLKPGDLLLTGGVTWGSTNGFDLTSATNSVFAIDRTGRILDRYDKAHLVPYGEYLPMRPILSRLGLSRLAPGDVDFEFGPGPQTLDLPLAGRSGSSCATRSSSPATSSTRAIGQPSSSIRRTTPGSAASARRSTLRRRGFARLRRGFRCSAPLRPASPP